MKTIDNERILRRQYLIDRRTQWRIARGLAVIWFAGGLAVAAFPVFATLVFGLLVQEKSFDELALLIGESIWFPLLMALLVAPVGIWWSIRFSNKIAGPVFRFNRDLRRLLAGEQVVELKLRKSDFFRSLESTFDEIRERMLELESLRNSSESTRESREPAGSSW